jgi:hypothetical protein
LTQPVVAKNDMPAALMQAPMIGVSKVLTEAQ